MNKFQKSQVLVLFVLVLLIITPFLPSSLRPTFLYFILNFTIIALGAEAGLLSLFSISSEDSKQKPVMPQESFSEDRKHSVSVTLKHVNVMPQEAFSEAIFSEKEEASTTTTENVKKELKDVEKSVVPLVCVTIVDKVQKCLAIRPSLFFIGGEESDAETMDEEENEAEEEFGRVKGQELFAKAEAFIGNFYKQLKIQREESSIHQKSF